MNKLTLALILALALTSWVAKSQYDDIRDLRTANRALTEAAERAVAREKRDGNILVAREGVIASQARKLARTQQALSEALSKNPAWAKQPVPNEVQEALTNGR